MTLQLFVPDWHRSPFLRLTSLAHLAAPFSFRGHVPFVRVPQQNLISWISAPAPS